MEKVLLVKRTIALCFRNDVYETPTYTVICVRIPVRGIWRGLLHDYMPLFMLSINFFKYFSLEHAIAFLEKENKSLLI